MEEEADAIAKAMTACVTGATGYVASSLVKHLLHLGYNVHATVRDPDNKAKVSHLLNLAGVDRLKLFQADLAVDGTFDEAVMGCDFVFHVATPLHFDSLDPENDMIKPAIQGTVNVLSSCAKAKTVKRVVLTSSAAAASINNNNEPGQVVTEECWTDVNFLLIDKPPTWGYPVSKALAEKAAWEFAKDTNLDLVTIVPVLVSGPALTPEIPSSVLLSLSPLIAAGGDGGEKDDLLLNGLKGMQLLAGAVSVVHIEDVCRAHVFLAEKKTAAGRYICCSVNTSVPELAKFLAGRYPQYQAQTDFGHFPAKSKLSMSSGKLIKEGFSFKYGMEEIYDQSLEYVNSKGLLCKSEMY